MNDLRAISTVSKRSRSSRAGSVAISRGAYLVVVEWIVARRALCLTTRADDLRMNVAQTEDPIGLGQPEGTAADLALDDASELWESLERLTQRPRQAAPRRPSPGTLHAPVDLGAGVRDERQKALDAAVLVGRPASSHQLGKRRAVDAEAVLDVDARFAAHVGTDRLLAAQVGLAPLAAQGARVNVGPRGGVRQCRGDVTASHGGRDSVFWRGG